MMTQSSDSLAPLAGLLVLVPIIVLGIMMTVAALLMAFWIWMIVDCAKHESSSGNDKVVWMLIIIFTHWIGALIYFFVRRLQRKKLGGRPPPLIPPMP